MKYWGLVRYSKGRASSPKSASRASMCVAAAMPMTRVRCREATCRSSSWGREIMLKPKLMIVAQPTWGVDVGASAVLRQALLDLSRNGVAILVISEELEELFEISDRHCRAGARTAFAGDAQVGNECRIGRHDDVGSVRRGGSASGGPPCFCLNRVRAHQR